MNLSAFCASRHVKPVRARTGSELQRECILSLGIKRAGEGIREDETRSQRNNNNALPDSFLYESLEAREQDGITAAEHESMIP